MTTSNNSHSIDAQTVEHLGVLARIDLTDDDVEKMTTSLEQIVEAFSSVQAAATDDVDETSHPIALENVLRDDVVTHTLDREIVLSQAPEEEDGQFKVPSILGD